MLIDLKKLHETANRYAITNTKILIITIIFFLQTL